MSKDKVEGNENIRVVVPNFAVSRLIKYDWPNGQRRDVVLNVGESLTAPFTFETTEFDGEHHKVEFGKIFVGLDGQDAVLIEFRPDKNFLRWLFANVSIWPK